MKIQDDFLPQEQYEHIRKTMMGSYFPWFYNSSVLDGTDYDNDISDRGQFTHAFLAPDDEVASQKVLSSFSARMEKTLSSLSSLPPPPCRSSSS